MTSVIYQKRDIKVMKPPIIPPYGKSIMKSSPMVTKKNRKMTTEEVTWTLDRKGDFQNWSYNGPTGPEFWQKSFPVAASEYQSPVNIDTKKIIYDSKLKSLVFDGYRDFRGGAKVLLQNNGSTVKLKLFDEVTLTRGDMPDVYQAIHVLFHWGANNQRGSEHLNNGTPYPMEVQIVHRNLKYSEDEMYDKQDGLLILAFWVEIGESSNDSFKYVTDHLQKIRFKDQEAKIDQFPLISLLPEDTTVYYTYDGSLTTPPCNECVNWVVLSDTTKISKKQIDKFRQLYSSEDDTGEMMADNYRPPQKIHRRKIKVCMSLRDEEDEEEYL
ncbi:carbonic anhydrase 2-like isoform X1 [Clytia hemisphaerica]|uniref:carbonic anhydrase n=1 Tax=Clytia hemisphaerica TaxID=252671 RepID=A0A7M5WWQ2_9CNID